MLEVEAWGGANLLAGTPPLFGGLPARGPSGCVGDYGAFILEQDTHISMQNHVLAGENDGFK